MFFKTWSAYVVHFKLEYVSQTEDLLDIRNEMRSWRHIELRILKTLVARESFDIKSDIIHLRFYILQYRLQFPALIRYKLLHLPL